MSLNEPFLCIVSICLTLQAVTLTVLLTARIWLGAAQMSAAGNSARSRKTLLLSHHIKLQKSQCHLRGQTLFGFITLVLVHALVLGWSQSSCWISNTLCLEFSLMLLLSSYSLITVTSVFFSCVLRTWLGSPLWLLGAQRTWYLATHTNLDCKLKISIMVTNCHTSGGKQV